MTEEQRNATLGLPGSRQESPDSLDTGDLLSPLAQGTPIPTPHIPPLTPKSTHSTSPRGILPIFQDVEDQEGVQTLSHPS